MAITGWQRGVMPQQLLQAEMVPLTVSKVKLPASGFAGIL
jgi:hypothetical protein